jgi:hypothetical protein
MATTITPQNAFVGSFKRWLLKGVEEPTISLGHAEKHPQHPWWKVMCLTGVDYFSTLGYQPGIAFLAAGVLSPVATLVLVLLTLFGALPVYSRVAAESPHGQGSISMLGDLLPSWKGKLFILCLLGFAATDFIITITLSAADATAHLIENPFAPGFLRHPVFVTLFLIGTLGAIFLKGFREAIGLAVLLVGIYLALNVIVAAVGIYELAIHPWKLLEWKVNLFAQYQNPLILIGVAFLVFPKLALGLSGFETGVAVMPLVKGPGRIHNTRKMLFTAAIIMSVMLIASSIVTTTLIPAAEFEEGGKANGRALAFLAHLYLGEKFGTIYDLSTMSILWFAGASAMAGLLTIVPRYLPRFGMAPNWARATRPLVLVFTSIAFAVTIIFKADVAAQGGAYATGVLVLMTSAAIAVTISSRRKGDAWWPFLFISVIFIYTTIVNIIERPEGIKIASFFIGSIIIMSLISRVARTTELRVDRVDLDEAAQRFIHEASKGNINIVANRCDKGTRDEYDEKEHESRLDNHIPPNEPVLFFEVEICDASEFSNALRIKGVEVDGHRVLRAESSVVPNAIAAFLLHLRDHTGKIPHAYFGWTEGNPIMYLLRYIAFGEGDTAPVTREVLRQAEPDPERRPSIHVGG